MSTCNYCSEVLRDAFSDSLKSILILLVVVGHCFSFFLEDRLVLSVYQTIYLFHMPLFICISGYFTHRSDNWKFFKSLANVFIVFLVNHILRIAYEYFVNGVFSFERLWWSYYGLWYLVALMLYRVVYQYGHRII